MNKMNLILVGLLSFTLLTHANIENENIYKAPLSGVEIIFSKQGQEWSKIKAYSESELTIGDRKDIRQSTSKAILRAKANISKFLDEKIKSEENIDSMTKTLTENNGKDSSTNRKTIETLTEKIFNSSDKILQGVLVLEQQVNIDKKYVSVTIGMSRNTISVANILSEKLQNKSTIKENKTTERDSNEKVEIRRSKNYDSF